MSIFTQSQSISHRLHINYKGKAGGCTVQKLAQDLPSPSDQSNGTNWYCVPPDVMCQERYHVGSQNSYGSNHKGTSDKPRPRDIVKNSRTLFQNVTHIGQKKDWKKSSFRSRTRAVMSKWGTQAWIGTLHQKIMAIRDITEIVQNLYTNSPIIILLFAKLPNSEITLAR